MILKILKRLGFSSLDLIRTRLEIASLDVKEARIRLVSILIMCAFAFMLIATSIVLGIFMLVFTFWQTNLLLAIGIMTFVLALTGIVLFVIVFKKLKNGPEFFEGILSELEKDLDAIGGHQRRIKE
ncbi:MAG: phage holin family protein [Candidatus Delongbacteria bacterium]